MTRSTTPRPDRRDVLRGTLGIAGAAVAARLSYDAPAAQALPAAPTTASGRRPNILLVLADDLGSHELGCYGQDRIQTPVADALALEGLRFTQAYANPSCAPTRCSLLTGLHTGHATVKENNQAPTGFAPEDATIGEVLKSAGYATGIIGKWGFGSNTQVDGSHPQHQGFDHFFGYIGHNAAHDYWPTTLWRDGQQVSYPENQGADVTYATDLFTEDALDFVRTHRDEPFFLYLAYTTPHAPNEIPSDAPYSDEDWPEGERNHAAQITRLDTDLGRVLAELEAQGIADETIVVFTSDNGPHAAGKAYQHVGSTLPHDPEFFDSNGDLRDIKFTVYEGGHPGAVHRAGARGARRDRRPGRQGADRAVGPAADVRRGRRCVRAAAGRRAVAAPAGHRRGGARPRVLLLGRRRHRRGGAVRPLEGRPEGTRAGRGALRPEARRQ